MVPLGASRWVSLQAVANFISLACGTGRIDEAHGWALEMRQKNHVVGCRGGKFSGGYVTQGAQETDPKTVAGSGAAR
jgi:hypothetical protein